MSLKDKTVWITGASSGIGAALAREYVSRGAKLILSGRDQARLDEVAADCGECLVLPFDVRDDAALADATGKAIEWQGDVDVAIANAGVSQRSRALKTDIQVYRDIIDIDLTAQIAFAQGLIGHMAERGSGSLAFISSIAGKVGVPMRTAYSAAKFGLAGYADALRAELSINGVQVHTIFPGSIATGVSRNALTADGSNRGRSDDVIDNGIKPDAAAKIMVDAMEAGEREIIVAEGVEQQMGEMRRTPEQLHEQMAGMVAAGYMDKMEAE
ncbi:SDR family NAD(P)-dependent oxidoreductase [Altererythrobacter sp. MF3-039]|uniref:SDR family NAD(P)-dependent oxidoreductase n=1 Tax=Altererythrobacter sp. MF3-039 TaxID=3252901 RepID=UPI00390C8922